MKEPDPAVAQLVAAIDEAFDARAWHGTNLRGSLRGLTATQAAWRPGAGRHNIWEIVVHAAYWKYRVRRAVTGEERGSFPLKGSNWFVRDRQEPLAWQQDLELLADQHRGLRAVIESVASARLGSAAGQRYTLGALIRGIAAHDLYHAGQIQLLKRMQVTAGPRRGR
jgi:DinB superfamily